MKETVKRGKRQGRGKPSRYSYHTKYKFWYVLFSVIFIVLLVLMIIFSEHLGTAAISEILFVLLIFVVLGAISG